VPPESFPLPSFPLPLSSGSWESVDNFSAFQHVCSRESTGGSGGNQAHHDGHLACGKNPILESQKPQGLRRKFHVRQIAKKGQKSPKKPQFSPLRNGTFSTPKFYQTPHFFTTWRTRF
jgi:hypothetical protein